MIVLLNNKEQTAILYNENGMTKIPFQDIDDLINYVGSNKVLYITNAKMVETIDIISLVRNLNIKYPQKNSVQKTIEEKGNKYIHAKSDGKVRISDDLVFENKFDCRLIDDDMRKNIKSNNILQILIQKGKIEIIGETGRGRLMKEMKEIQKKEKEKQEKLAKKNEKALKKAKGEISDDDDDDERDVISIDLEEKGGIEVGGGLSVNTMTELLENL